MAGFVSAVDCKPQEAIKSEARFLITQSRAISRANGPGASGPPHIEFWRPAWFFYALLLATFCIAATHVGKAHAIGLDEISQQSGLGQPLRLVIPLITNAADEIGGEDFAGECFKIVPANATDLPQPSLARVALEHRGGRAFVVVTTAYPINEPMMRVAVQAGCRVSLSREYTVLLDPVSIEPPVVQVAAAAPAVEPAASARAEPQAPAVAAVAREPRPVQRSVAPRKHVASAVRTKPASAPKRTGDAVAASVPRIAPQTAKASAGPRLQVSRTIDDAAATPAKPGAAQLSAAESETLKALEEETVVLQKRIAELSLTMEQMQKELLAAKTARDEAEKAAREAKQRAAAAPPPSSETRILADVNWPLVVVVLGLIALLAAVVHMRRKPVLVPAPITAAQEEAFNPADLGEPSVPQFPTTGGKLSVPELTEVDTLPPAVRVATPAGLPPIAMPATVAPASTPPAPVPEFKYDPELMFDFEVEKTAEAYSEYSTLEREQPGIVAKLTSTWGSPEAAVRLEHYLLTPRRGGKPLSREAMAELKLLQTLARDFAGGYSELPIPPADRTYTRL